MNEMKNEVAFQCVYLALHTFFSYGKFSKSREIKEEQQCYICGPLKSLPEFTEKYAFERT